MKTAKGTSLRTDCAPELLHFASFDRRKIEGSFTGGDVSSDGGVMALRAADKKLGLVAALNAVIEDPREASQIVHEQQDLLRQRIYGLAMGYEDLNDHDTLRKDLLWQSAVERGEDRLESETVLPPAPKKQRGYGALCPNHSANPKNAPKSPPSKLRASLCAKIIDP